MDTSSYSILSTFHTLPTIFTLTTLLYLSTTPPCLAARPLQSQTTSNTNFIKTSCEATLYPDLCYKTLSSYAATIQTSAMELASTAISVALRAAQSATNIVSELSKGNELSHRQGGAIEDCVDTMDDSVDELQKSLAAMKELKGPNFQMEKNNVQTWVSAALTDADTCMDGFEVKDSDKNKNKNNGKVKGAIRSNVLIVAQLTSNALAFINRL